MASATNCVTSLVEYGVPTSAIYGVTIPGVVLSTVLIGVITPSPSLVPGEGKRRPGAYCLRMRVNLPEFW